MADKKITDLTAVVTPAGTDVYEIAQGGVSKQITFTQLEAALDHGSIGGLSGDDHTQYSLISSQAGAPSSTPGRVGEVNIDTSGEDVYVAKGTASSADWVQVNNATGLANIVDDTTPQLGGELDAQGNNIIDLGDVTFQTGASGGTLRTGTSAADKFQLQAYDVDGAAYVTVLQIDAGNTIDALLPADYWHFQDLADATKQFKFDASSITTSTERTLTVPDATGTLALLESAQTFTADQTLEESSSSFRTLTMSAAYNHGAAQIAAINFDGQDGSGGTDTYAAIEADASTVTAGSEAGTMSLRVAYGGSLEDRVVLNSLGMNVYCTYANAAVDYYRTDAHGSSQSIGKFSFYGKDSASNTDAFGQLQCIVTDHTSTSEDGVFDINTIYGGTFAQNCRFAGGLVMSGATGGDKGRGTINATAVYDDDSLLTCYAPELMDADGDPVTLTEAQIDAAIAEWDAKVPDRDVYRRDPETGEDIFVRTETRVHEGARKFFERLRRKLTDPTEYDPRDIADAVRHYRDKKHLTPFPNPDTFQHGDLSAGDWIQRLIEQAELNAMWAYRLHRQNSKLKTALQALEARVAALESA